jgi:hypothetical protein
MALSDGRAARSAVTRSAVTRSAVTRSAVTRSAVTRSACSRSFVAIENDEKRVALDRSCTPERLRP